MLTGDKTTTAESIGISSGLTTPTSMKLELTTESIALERIRLGLSDTVENNCRALQTLLLLYI